MSKIHNLRINTRSHGDVNVAINCVSPDNAQRIAVTQLRANGYVINHEVKFQVLPHDFGGVTHMYIDANRIFGV